MKISRIDPTWMVLGLFGLVGAAAAASIAVVNFTALNRAIKEYQPSGAEVISGRTRAEMQADQARMMAEYKAREEMNVVGESLRLASGDPTYTVGTFVMNPGGGSRFILADFAFTVDSPETVEELKARDAEVRDALLKFLSAVSVEEIADTTRRGDLSRELIAVVAKHTSGEVRMMFIPQFVIQ